MISFFNPFLFICQINVHILKRGLRVKILLLTNPNNPLGVIYEPGVIRSCIEWARTHGMHTIVDEIYALSIHVRNEKAIFN